MPSDGKRDAGRTAGGLYARLAGGAWAELSEPVRRLHEGTTTVRGSGRFDVRHGKGWAAPLLTRLAGMPAAGDRVPVSLVVTPGRDGTEEWSRNFGGRPFVTLQRAHPRGLMAERVGPVEVLYRIESDGGALVYRPERAALCAGPLRVPVPLALAPRIEAREWAEPGDPRVRVRVRVRAPLVGLLITYEGSIELESAP